MKKTMPFAFLVIIACLFTTLTSCTKDTLADKIEGNWEVTSWVEDGDEALGVDYTKINIEFEEPDDNEGDVEFNLTYDDGSVEIIKGTYEANDDDDEVTISFTNGTENATFEVDIDNDELEMDGTYPGGTIVIKAERD